MENGKQPINPQEFTKVGEGINDYEPKKGNTITGHEKKYSGLTKREYFAIALMQGLCSGRTKHECPGADAKYAVDLADSLLKELEK
jgi:hypothetical protein|tara:strand:- start:704 stop:961 length:258 start_codon:yes stop_codon:yes gene_type:complete